MALGSLPSALRAMRASTLRFLGKVSALSMVTMVTSFCAQRASVAPPNAKVTIVERDTFPPIGDNRRGVPQGRHVHGLHARGRQVLEELFPGLTDELVEAGAVMCDTLGSVRWQLWSYQVRQADMGLPAVLAS